MYFYSPLDWMLVHNHCRVYTCSIKFTSTHEYNWLERGTLRVKCLKEHYTMLEPEPLNPESVSKKHTNHDTIMVSIFFYSSFLRKSTSVENQLLILFYFFYLFIYPGASNLAELV